MSLPHPLVRSLIGVFLLAAGCETTEGFVEERDVLDCEIQQACGLAVDCEDPISRYMAEDPECHRIDRAVARECIDRLEKRLSEVQSDARDCGNEWVSECDDALVTRRKCGPNHGPPGPGQPVDGRPLVHEGRWVLAEVVAGDVWSERGVEVPEGDPSTARVAAERWLRSAQTEHASVVAFSRVALELMAVGAPPELLEGCHRAALDEIRHARMALDVARALGDASWDLGALPSVPVRVPTLRQIAVDALLEGCIGEGGAAAAAHVAADRAEGSVAEVLRTIAEDETRHAALAWATLRWALQQDRSLTGPLREALAQARAERRGAQGRTDPAQARLGVVAPQEARQIERDVIDSVVEPVLATMLGEVTASAVV